MSYNLDWRGWPTGWDRTNPFRIINFLGKNSSNTYQNVLTPDGRKFYLCRRGDTGALEIRFMRRTAFAYGEAGRLAGAYVDWPEWWPPRKGEYVPHAWRQLVRQALTVTNI